jgi:intraflagellar transport protein 140
LFVRPKAKAPESLALFYVSCAQVEIDEFKNYEKALGALKESAKYMAKATIPTKEAKLNMIKKKVNIVEQFLAIKKGFSANPEESIRQAGLLIERNDLEDTVRMGDMYSLIVEYLYSQQQFEEAMEVLNRMKQRRINILYYLEKNVVVDIYKATKTAIDFPLEEEGEQHHHHDNAEIAEEM